MVTKRELADAQSALNMEVARLCDELGRLRSGHMSETWPLGIGVGREFLRPVYDAYDAWAAKRLQLEGEGPAVARSTSIAAAKSRIMLKQSVRRDILQMVVAHHNRFGVGMTSDQIMARLQGKHQTVSARVSELVNTYQLLRDSGQKRFTSSQSLAIIWEPTDEARQLVAAAVAGREPDA